VIPNKVIALGTRSIGRRAFFQPNGPEEWKIARPARKQKMNFFPVPVKSWATTSLFN
jgi:hypothetical protein